MLGLSVALLGLTVVLGGALVLACVRAPGKRPSAWLAGAHGTSAVLGYAILLTALIEGPARGGETGTQSFGATAAVLLLLAVALGIASLVIHFRKRRLPGFWAGAHATIAIAGYVILAVYLLLG